MEHTKTYEYEVTIMGQVFSTTSNWRGYGPRQLIPKVDPYGYLCVRLTINGKRKHMHIHKLVAHKYLPKRPTPQHQLRHLDGNKNNNSADNLAWGTSKDNADDRERHGRTSRGERHSKFIKAGLDARHV